MKNKKAYKLIIIFTLSLMLLLLYCFNKTKAVTVEVVPVEMDGGKLLGNFNINGKSGSKQIKTTFNDIGYETFLSVNGEAKRITNLQGSLNGVTLNTVLSIVNNNHHVKITYQVHNGTNVAKTIGIATLSDVQISGSDDAKEIDLGGDRGFKMTNKESQKYTFIFYGRKIYGVTDVDTYWFGSLWSYKNADCVFDDDTAYNKYKFAWLDSRDYDTTDIQKRDKSY